MMLNLAVRINVSESLSDALSKKAKSAVGLSHSTKESDARSANLLVCFFRQAANFRNGLFLY